MKEIIEKAPAPRQIATLPREYKRRKETGAPTEKTQGNRTFKCDNNYGHKECTNITNTSRSLLAGKLFNSRV